MVRIEQQGDGIDIVMPLTWLYGDGGLLADQRGLAPATRSGMRIHLYDWYEEKRCPES